VLYMRGEYQAPTERGQSRITHDSQIQKGPSVGKEDRGGFGGKTLFWWGARNF